MRFTPKTEKEVQEEGLLPEGIYDFEVLAAKDTVSQKGNDMVEIKLQIADSSGRQYTIMDWLLEAFSYKIRHFAHGVGLLPRYETGDMPAEIMIGRTGQCRIVIQPAKGQYRAKNAVADYLSPSAVGASAVNGDPRPTPPDDFDDSIPF